MEQGVSERDASAYLDPLLTPDAMNAVINWYRARGSLPRTLPEVRRPILYRYGSIARLRPLSPTSSLGWSRFGPLQVLRRKILGYFLFDLCGSRRQLRHRASYFIFGFPDDEPPKP